ncbi:hypothetical protein ACMA46_14175 [Clavibacter sp. Sh2141]|uniref:hypothetical protein n=1 Tax=Clavibacter sp. Sh2141 TaxID=3395374 RepID=UPI0039BC85E5
MTAPKTSRTVRTRRGSMASTGVLIAVVLVLAAGLLVPMARPECVRPLVLVLAVGVAVALAVSAMRAGMLPWLAGLLVGSFLSRDEWPWRRTPEDRLRERQPRPLSSIRPWSGSGLAASLTDVPIGLRGATETGVLREAGEVSAQFRVDELHQVVSDRGGLAESVDADPADVPGGTVHLTRVDVASPDSTVGEVLVGLPADALALVPVREPLPGPVAVLTGSDLASFRAWARTIPAP